MAKEFEVWAEKYRPKTFDEIINQENTVERVKAFAKSKNIPHMLFAGPPGSGKCLEKGSLIFTFNGLKKVEEIKESQRVLSLDPNGKFSFHMVKGIIEREDRIYSVETHSGCNIGVTFEHPFLTLENGLPTWKSVKELKEGDFVATIRELNLENEEPLDFSKVENLFARVKKEIEVDAENLFDGKKREIIRILADSPLTFDEICNKGNIKRSTAIEMLRQLKKDGIVDREHGKYVLKKRKIATKVLPFKNVTGLQKEEIESISVKTKNGFSTWIRLFEDNEDFYEWLGCVLSEGHIERSRIIFYNTNSMLLDRFVHLTRKLFGLNVERMERCVTVRCGATLTTILSSIFDVYVGKKKSYNIKVPARLFTAKKEKVARFIRAYFDGDGSFYNNQIEVSSNSKEMLLGIKTLLLKFGIVSQVYLRKLLISGSEQVKKFAKEIGSLTKKLSLTTTTENTNKDVLPFAADSVRFIMDTLGFTYKDLVAKKKELEYLFKRRRGSYRKVKKIYTRLLEKSREKIIKLIEVLDELELITNLDKTQLENDIKAILNMLQDVKLRRELEELVKIRYDRLLEYYKEKRKPSISSFIKIVKALMYLRKIDEETYSRMRRMSFVLEVLKNTFGAINVSYNSACSDIHPATLALDLREEVTSLKSVLSLIGIAEKLKKIIVEIITNKKLITTLELLDFLVKAEIFWDRIKKIEEKGYGKVYDLEIENSHNFVGGNGLILHNTTLALVLARELYGDQWRQNVLQTNASDERKIEVIRGKVKEFARTVAIGDVPFKLIVLDEADALTNEAQQALRRMMEMYANVSRFVFCVNYSSKIIEPLQSRCAVFRFKALDDKHVEEFVNRIVKGEKLKITEDGIKAVVRISEGDLRKAANILQVASALKEKITEDVVYEAASLARPQEVKQMLELALSGKFMEARKMLEDMIIKKGLAGSDIVAEIHRQIPSLNIDDRAKVELVEKCGEIDFRISEGANELIQLESLLASFLLYAHVKGKK